MDKQIDVSYCRGVDHPGIQIDQPFLIQSNVQPLKQLVERAVVSPITKALIHSRPWAEALRQIGPGST